MLLILEGLDKCGKTTFANKFIDVAEIKHCDKNDDVTNVLLNAASTAKTGNLVILDRSFLSEMCYGPVYRGEMHVTSAKLMKITRALKQIDYCILYFSRPSYDKDEFDSKDEFEKDFDKLMMVKKSYEDYIARFKNRFNIYEIQYK